jgi:hypothetical protein
MRTLLLPILLCLSLGSCVALKPDVLPTDGALGRQVQRVVQRHDDYVLGDLSLDRAASDAALGESAALQVLVGLPEVSRSVFRSVLAPVASRHDAYVRADPSLDDLERETYLASTDGLRRLAGGE